MAKLRVKIPCSDGIPTTTSSNSDPARDVEVKAKLKVKIPCSDGIQMTSSNSAGGLGEFRTSWEISLSCDEEPEELSSNLWRQNSSHECTFQDPALRLDPPQTTPTDGHMATKDPARTWCCARCQSDAGDSLKKKEENLVFPSPSPSSPSSSSLCFLLIQESKTSAVSIGVSSRRI
ncbi:hypothetical protein AAC387_Pa07g3640 [Persea americana]